MAKYLERLAARARGEAPQHGPAPVLRVAQVAETPGLEDSFEAVENEAVSLAMPVSAGQDEAHAASRPEQRHGPVQELIHHPQDSEGPEADVSRAAPARPASAGGFATTGRAADQGTGDRPGSLMEPTAVETSDESVVAALTRRQVIEPRSVGPAPAASAAREDFVFDRETISQSHQGKNRRPEGLDGQLVQPLSLEHDPAADGAAGPEAGNHPRNESDFPSDPIIKLLTPITSGDRAVPALGDVRPAADASKVSIGSITVELTAPPQPPAPPAPRRRPASHARSGPRPTAARSRNSFGLGQV